MATIRDVAKLAKVSPASVSRILNNDKSYKASPETVERVLKVVKEINYTIPPTYRKKNNLCFGCINRVTEERTKDSYYSSIYESVQQYCIDNSIELNLVQSQFDLNNPDILNKFLSSKMDGVIIMGGIDHRIIDIIMQKNIHIVGIDTDSDKIDNIRYNRYQAGCIAMEYLVKNGHRKIAYIGSHLNPDEISNLGRFEAYKKILESINQPLNKHHIIDCKWQRAICYNKTQELLDAPDRPTAIFIASDHMAAAALSSITARGLKVPDDISIIGITDIESSKYLNPPLTTVNIPQADIGTIAATTLFNRIKGDKTIPKQIFVPTHLVIRNSVKSIL